MKRNFVMLLAVLVAAVFSARTTNAAVPMLLSHQGRLLDASDQPVTGTRDITFHIYGDSIGGLPLWTESHLAVPIDNGLFHVTLGGTATIDADLFANTGPGVFNPANWLVLQIEGTELMPRMRLSSVPTAVLSSRVSGDVETLPGALTVKGMSGSTTGTIRMQATADSVGNYLDVDDDGDGIAEARGIIVTKGGGGSGTSASGKFFVDSDDDGVVDNSVEQVSNASKAYMAIKTKGGPQGPGGRVMVESSDSAMIDCSVDDDNDGTARAKGIVTCKPASGGAGGTKGKFSYDVDDDGDFDNEVEISSDSTGAISILSGMSASRSATLNISASPGGSASAMSHDADNDGTPEHSIDQDCDEISSRTILTGLSGSTTGTIRLAATPDSAENEVSFEDTPSGISSKVKEKAHRAKCSANLAYLRTSAPASSTELDESCDSISASSRWKGGMSGSTTGTIRMAAAPESTVSIIEQDDDGDGISEARGIVTTRPTSGSAGSVSHRLIYDTDDNGVEDNSVEHASDASGAHSRMIGGMSGSTTGTIRMAATPDSGVLELGYSGSTTATIRMLASPSISANPIEHSSGAHLTVGGAWTNASDKNAKENFVEVNGQELLEKIEELSITQWNYKSEDESITHIGPTAQDFKEAFGVGGNDKSISTVDPSGIALAAIKELNKQNQELTRQNIELKKQLDDLKKRIDELISNQ